MLREQKDLVRACRQLSQQVGGLDDDQDPMLQDSFLQEFELDATFSVVVAGEFNAGKSTLINALLGTKLLESGSLPTTDCITIVAHDHGRSKKPSSLPNQGGEEDEESQQPSLPLGVVAHTLNLPLLDDLTIIDTPGTNSTWLDHTERTMRLLPSADLILFVTSADRPFSESEKKLLQGIQAYRKSIVLVVNKMDILDSAGGDHGREEKNKVVDFVSHHASELLGAQPIVLPVSARDALAVKLQKTTNVSSNWQRSNFEALELFLKDSLTTQAKLKSKLSSPIGVVEGVMERSLQKLKEDRTELETDISTLRIFQSQFEGWKKELEADLISARHEMANLLRKEGERCDILLNRLSWVQLYRYSLIETDVLSGEWEDTHVSSSLQKGLEKELVAQVNETADAIATRGRAQGQNAIEYLGKRPAMKNHSLIGSVTTASRFEDTRRILDERLSEAVSKIALRSIDEPKAVVFDSLRNTALVSSALNIGGLASIVCTAIEIIDPVVGIATTSGLALSGGAWLALGTSRIRSRYQQEWSDRAESLDEALKEICDKEVERVNRRILDGVAPYTRFVESETGRIHDLREKCEQACTAARNLRNRINKLS